MNAAVCFIITLPFLTLKKISQIRLQFHRELRLMTAKISRSGRKLQAGFLTSLLRFYKILKNFLLAIDICALLVYNIYVADVAQSVAQRLGKA